MKIEEAMSILDQRKPNSFLFEEKVQWLNQLDWRIVREVFDTHVCGDGADFIGYTADTDRGTELLVPAPYDEVYISYMGMMIDMINGETARYNNSAALFNRQYADFANWYNRHHKPKGATLRYW